MGSVVNLTDFKKKKTVEQKKPKSVSKQKKQSNEFKLFISVLDELNVQWSMYASQDKLNKLISNTLSVFNDNFIDDLNAIAKLEKKFNTSFVIFHPGMTTGNPTGYLAGFHHDGEAYTTPEMINECYARCYCLLLRRAFTEAINNQ